MAFGAQGPAGELRDRGRPARPRRLGPLEHHEARAFTEVGPPTPAVERPARLRVERGDGVEAREREATEPVASAGHDRVDLSREQPRGRDDQRVGPARARARQRPHAGKWTEALVEAIDRRGQRVRQHAAQHSMAFRLAVQRREEPLGLEHPPRRAADHQADARHARLQSRHAHRFARRGRRHRARPGPRARDVGWAGGQIDGADLARHARALALRIEQRHGRSARSPRTSRTHVSSTLGPRGVTRPSPVTQSRSFTRPAPWRRSRRSRARS